MRYLAITAAFFLGLVADSYLRSVKAQGGSTVHITVVDYHKQHGEPVQVPGEPVGFSCAEHMNNPMECYILSR